MIESKVLRFLRKWTKYFLEYLTTTKIGDMRSAHALCTMGSWRMLGALWVLCATSSRGRTSIFAKINIYLVILWRGSFIKNFGSEAVVVFGQHCKMSDICDRCDRWKSLLIHSKKQPSIKSSGVSILRYLGRNLLRKNSYFELTL